MLINGIDKDTFKGYAAKAQRETLFDGLASIQTVLGERAKIWDRAVIYIKIQWWWISAISLSILAAAFFAIRMGIIS